jgi:hypothetical protein
MDYYKGDSLFGGVYSIDNLPKKILNTFYIVNFNKQKEPGSHWVCVISINESRCYYFDSFGIYPPPEIKKFMYDSNTEILINTYRIQALDSMMCGYFCIYMINEMCKGRQFYDILLEFDPNNYKKNDQLILNLI